MDSLGVHRSGVQVESRYRDVDNVSYSRATRRRENIHSQAWSQEEWDSWQGRSGWSQEEWNSWRGSRR